MERALQVALREAAMLLWQPQETLHDLRSQVRFSTNRITSRHLLASYMTDFIQDFYLPDNLTDKFKNNAVITQSSKAPFEPCWPEIRPD